MKYLPRVLRYLRPYSRLAVGSVVIIVASGLVSLLAPWPLKILVDSVLGDQPLPAVLSSLSTGNKFLLLGLVVAASLAVTLAADALSVLENYVNTKIDLGMALDFRGDLFRHAQRLSLAFHDRSQSGMLIYAVNFQADSASRLVMTVPPLAQSVITLVGMFWITFTINRGLALLSLVVVPFLYYSVGYYIRNIQGRLTEVKTMEGQVLSVIHEAMAMLRVIVAFGRESYEHARYREQGERARAARVRLTVHQTLFSLGVNLTTSIGTALVLGFGAYQAIQGRLTVGQLLVVMTYVAGVYRPLETISKTAGALQDQLVSLRMAFDLLDTEPEIKDAPDASEIKRAEGHVRFESVDFSYTGRAETLADVSLEARPGQTVALVGPTGAGKTTLVSLLPRFYDPARGRVMLDGRDVRSLTLESLRRQISIVLQEPLLFSCSLADNIRYGRLDATEDEIVQAAKDAGAHDFITRLPEGYSTLIGERGAQLSGGERQRVAIARAFLKDAPVLILDEPTSSVDSKTETVILDALDRL
ncbi:MAG TPA: ABC transporter ATP-binding protein, partial [Pyrinomonadaceae bacterium]|nr:ABC transporter ATP-binding protein [Pyrinomonadaceae bacterium]